ACQRRQRTRLRHRKAAHRAARAPLVRAPEVIEDGVRAVEPLPSQALFVTESAVSAAKGDVGFARNVPRDAPLDQDAAPLVCSRSMLSNNARKLPSPNPRSPLRWMIS